jgi:N-acetylglucosaminyldiphosphoundecaprenol N-acetyl-beta-D-mannosaminyltransferase
MLVSNHSRGYVDILGVNVSAINMDGAVCAADRWIRSGKCGYVCVTSVHGVMEAQRDPSFRHILNHGVMNLPDGMPLVWVGKLQGAEHIERVFGPDFLVEICRLSVTQGYRHFLYGGAQGVASELKRSLEQRFPGIEIVGTYTPPFRPLNDEEEHDILAQIQTSRADVVWIGLSTPKQERFMAQFVSRLRVPLLVGVGAAFDYHTGRIRDCPPWVKRSGLQWFHRLLQDPGRLWRRYLHNNPAFIWKIFFRFVRSKKGRKVHCD